MRTHRRIRRRLLAWTGLGMLVLILAACAGEPLQPEEATAVAHLLTVQPGLAATLTAWPSPPPLVTRAPTRTAAPQSVWTAEAQPLPSAPASSAISPSAADSSTPNVGAPVGSKPPPVRLLIPRLGLDVPVVQISWDIVFQDGAWRSEWQTADGAAGHHRNSANPGEAGNVIISGHHNTRGEVFRQVSEIGLPGSSLAPGDDVILVAQDGQRYAYAIVRWARFQESGVSADQQRQHAAYLDPTLDATLTLVTCWPYESNSHRVVVVAKLRP